MTNICAAIGLAQLERIDDTIAKKREIAELYKEKLKNSNIIFHQEHRDVYHSYWMCSILIDKIEDRELLRNHLSKNGIETRPLFYPVHTMPMYASKYEKRKEKMKCCCVMLTPFKDANIDRLPREAGLVFAPVGGSSADLVSNGFANFLNEAG